MTKEVFGYQGVDAVKQEEVIVCPYLGCGHIHVDEYGDMMILGEPVREGDKYAYFKCRRCKRTLFIVPGDSTDHPVPPSIIKKMKVRKRWDLAQLEERITEVEEK